MERSTLIIVSMIAIGALFAVLFLGGNTPPPSSGGGVGDVVRMENGVQIIHVLARGGYTPRSISAKAGIPTKLEIETEGTYDCSSAFTIPSLRYRKMLPPTGITLVDIPAQPASSTLTALCAMGMYSLEIQFN